MELETADGDFAIRISAVSETGLRFVGVTAASVGDAVGFSAMGRPVRGTVVRISADEGALRFDRPLDAPQLENLRQFRDLAMLTRA
jgi:hypothetical protein